MSDGLAFVHDAEPLKAIKAHVEMITLLIQQVTECGYFVTEYTKQENFCPSSFTSSRLPFISISRDSNSKIHLL